MNPRSLARTLLGKESRLRWIALGVMVGMSVGGIATVPATTHTGAIFEVGAAKVSIAPTPPAGRTWQTQGCFEETSPQNLDLDHALPERGHGSWPTSPECIYLGGFGIGPARAATAVDDGGVWVRAIAVGNGTQTFVYAIIDAVGYFARYQDAIAAGAPAGVCSDCGLLDIRNAMSTELTIPVNNMVLASTHSHSGPDGYGGWGGLPDWYWLQLRDAFKQAVRGAVAAMTPATIDVGSLDLQRRSNERRDTYYSASDFGAVWLQARDAADQSKVIATLLNFAAHPTITGGRVLHADWPGATARRFEALYGGTGVVFEGGLGNMSISSVSAQGDPEDTVAEKTGVAIADAAAQNIVDDPYRLTSTEMKADIRTIQHPIQTNKGLAVLGSLGVFTREFTPGTPGAGGPAVFNWSKSGLGQGYVRGCRSAAETSVITSAGAHRIGEFAVGFGPGEIFSNLTNVVKARFRNGTKAVGFFAQANDSLGYILQSFEYDYAGGGAVGAQAVGEYATGHGEYEEVFAIDHCFGDNVLQTVLDAGQAVGVR